MARLANRTGPRAAILILAATAFAPAMAAEPNDLQTALANRPVVAGVLSTEKAVALALKESPLLRGAEEEVAAARARVQTALAERRPWVSVNGFASGGSLGNITQGAEPVQPRMTMALPRGRYFDANVMLMVPLFTSGRLEAMVRAGRAMRSMTEADLAARRQEVALLCRQAYRQVVAARRTIASWSDRLRENEERLRVNRLRLEQGLVPAFTILRDQAEVAADGQALTNAQRDREIALIQWRTLLGVHPSSTCEVEEADGSSPPGAGLPRELPALLEMAGRLRPELRGQAARLEAARQESRGVRASFRPQVSLFAMADRMKMEGEPSLGGATYGAVLSFPLYNGGQARARAQEAEAERRKQEAERERLALQVTEEVTVALTSLRAAEANVGTARAALAAAREEYRVQKLRYEAGRSLQVEVLDALSARTEAEAALTRASLEAENSADRLARAVGIP